MKISSRLIFLILMFACFLAKSQTHVQFSFANGQFNISQYTNVQIILQPEQFNVSGTVTLLQPRIYRTTDTNASVTFSNLFGSYTGGYYRWTIPAFTSADGFNPPVTSSGDIQVVSTNLGLISSTLIGVVFVPTYNGSGAAWTAQASDWRYTASTNQLGSYVKIGDFNSATNSIVSLIQSTNGFVDKTITNGFSTLSSLTNYSYPISNPSNFVSVVIINGYATTNYVNSTVANLATTNSVIAATNSLASTNYVNGQGFLISSATNGLATTNQLNNYTLTAVFTAGTNSVATNDAANLIATNTALVALINSSTNGLNFAIGSSNSLLLSKQPASTWLTNLSFTGAFTNALSAGQNFSLTTNFSGNITILNATNQGFLTNGITGTAYQPLGYYLPTNALPSLTNGFVTSAITNGFATQNYVTNLISIGGINTNIYLAGQNVSFTTNVGGTIQFVNATNQTFLTNGLAGTNFVIASIVSSNASLASLTAVAATNTASLVIVTNLVQNSTNGLAGTSYVASAVSTGTNVIWTNALGYFYPTSNPSLFVNQGQLNGTNTAILIAATNLATASTNAGNIVFTNSPLLVQNNTAFQLKTNGFAQGFFGLGTKTNFLLTTNVISLIGGAYGNGTYVGVPFSVIWTNVFNPTNTVLLSGGNFYIQSNGVSLYQSTNILNWTLVNGIAPTPSGAWGSKWHMSGVQLDGWVYSTNISWQISSSLAAISITNLTGNALNQVTNIVSSGNAATALTATSATNFASGAMLAKLTSQRVKVLFVGDSYADRGDSYASTPGSLFDYLVTTYGLAGGGMENASQNTEPFFYRAEITNWFAANTGAVIPSDSASTSTSLFVNPNQCFASSGVIPPIYERRYFSPNNNAVNYAEAFWLAWANGGSITISNWQYGDSILSGLNGLASTPTVYKTNFNLVNIINDSPAFFSTTGTNIFLGMVLVNTNLPTGIIDYWASKGSIFLSTMTNCGMNALTTFGQAVNPDMVVYCARDEGEEVGGDLAASNSLVQVLSAFSTTNTTQIVVISEITTYVADISPVVSWNATLKQTCAAHGWTFVDLYSDFPNYHQNTNAGLMEAYATPIHPSFLGASIFGPTVAAHIGLGAIQPAQSLISLQQQINSKFGTNADGTITPITSTFTGTFTGSGSGLTGVKVADTNITGTITVTNNLASISPAVPNVVVTGNGSPSPNGTYIYTGALNGGNLYQNRTNWFIFYNGSYWLLANATSGFTKDWYVSGSIPNPPLNSALSSDTGTTGVPMIIPADILSVNGQVSITNNLFVGGTVTASGGLASQSSNTLALTSILFPATTVKWTNAFAINIFLFINNAGVTGTALYINGTQIASTLLVTGDTMLPLQPGEYFSETYTIGTPAAVWKPQ